MHYPLQCIYINVAYTYGLFGSRVVIVTIQLSLCFNMPCFVRLRFNSSSCEGNQLKFSDMVSNLMCLVFWEANLQYFWHDFKRCQAPSDAAEVNALYAATESWIICQAAQSLTVFFSKAVNLLQVVQECFCSPTGWTYHCWTLTEQCVILSAAFIYLSEATGMLDCNVKHKLNSHV